MPQIKSKLHRVPNRFEKFNEIVGFKLKRMYSDFGLLKTIKNKIVLQKNYSEFKEESKEGRKQILELNFLGLQLNFYITVTVLKM